MPPKNIPIHLESIILIAVEFGRDRGCQLDGHLVCRANGTEHTPLTYKEIISELAITISSMTQARTKGSFKEQTLPTIKEDVNPEESDAFEEWEGPEETVPLLNPAQLRAAKRHNSSILPLLPQDSTQAIISLLRSPGTSVTDTTDWYASTFSGAPGPGYITGKALYWTGSRMIAALERFRINNIFRSHIAFLQTKQTSINIRFQILEDALELSKPCYPSFINKYSVRLYLEYLKYLQQHHFPRHFLQTISSAMLTLSVITWASSGNYQGDLLFIRVLVKVCTKRPVRLHDSDERLATQRVISPHLLTLVPWYFYKTLFHSSFPDDNNSALSDLHGNVSEEFFSHTTAIFFEGFQDKYESWSQLSRSKIERVYGIYPFITSFPWLAAAIYTKGELIYRQEEGQNESNILVNFVSSCRNVKVGTWKTSTAAIAAYRSLISLGTSAYDDEYLSDLEKIARHTFSELFTTIDMTGPAAEQKKALKAFKEDELRKPAMEVVLEILVWVRGDLRPGTSRIKRPEPLWDRLLTLSKLELPNISPLAEKVLEWSEPPHSAWSLLLQENLSYAWFMERQQRGFNFTTGNKQ